MEIDFFDVGQGDGIFVETGDGKQMLVDGGPSNVILEKLGKEMGFYDRYIDLVILTHPEYDHIGGLIEVIKRYNIGAIITTGVVRDTNQYKEWIKIIEQKNIPIYIAQLGGQIDFGNNIKIDILFPFTNQFDLLGIDLKADVLKVPHHGSKTSSTEEFLQVVNSVINIIQAGKDNKYGHPHQEVLERMANVFITGKSGDVEILTNGKNF